MRGMTSGCDGDGCHMPVPELIVTGQHAIRLCSSNQLNTQAKVQVIGDRVAHKLLSLITTGAISAPF